MTISERKKSGWYPELETLNFGRMFGKFAGGSHTSPREMYGLDRCDVLLEDDLTWDDVVALNLRLDVTHTPSDPYFGPRVSPVQHNATLPSNNEIVALTRAIEELKREQRRDLRELTQRVQGIEQKLDGLISSCEIDTSEVPQDPHTRWIDQNRAVLRKEYPDTWVALDPDRGIIFHSSDGDEFASKLALLTTDERDRILAFHTSMYM